MYFVTLLSIAAYTVVATPILTQNTGPAWTPASGTVASCDASNDKYITISGANRLAKKVCVAIMGKCAFPQNAISDTVCAATVDWPLSKSGSVSFNDTVLNAAGDIISNVHPVFTVAPPVRPMSPDSEMWNGVMWTAKDCLGYFGQLLSQKTPSGCMTSAGIGAGNLTVGGTDSLKDTVFAVSFPESN